jgi:hypothetical protein
MFPVALLLNKVLLKKVATVALIAAAEALVKHSVKGKGKPK